MPELTTLDEKLLQMAADGMSAQEMAAETGQSPAKALLRVKEILRERDWVTEIERRQLLAQDLYELKRKVQEQNRDVDWITDKQVIALSKVIRDIDEVMEKNSAITATMLEKVSQAQSVAMLRLIEAGFTRARKLLADEYPDLSLGRLQEAFQQGLQEAADLVD